MKGSWDERLSFTVANFNYTRFGFKSVIAFNYLHFNLTNECYDYAQCGGHTAAQCVQWRCGST